ncbi:MAG: hypothetical protein KIT09_33200 [Bryobacteraceae bacterium]|nr:hypothetical protein [Bryobacteraceae bacterium]
MDMSAQMVMQYNSLAFICEHLGLSDKAIRYKERATEIARRINLWMWDDADGSYYDVDDQGRKIKVKTIAAFWPLVAGVADEHMADALVRMLKDPNLFWRQTVFPSLAADHLFYNPTGAYWLGGVWAPTNYMVIKGLEQYGYEDFAIEAATRYLTALDAVYQKTGTLWEVYAPDDFAPATIANGFERCEPDFVGWTGLGPIALLIENILGLRVDGSNDHVTWRLSRTDRHGIERLRVGAAEISLLCNERPSPASVATIVVVTNRPVAITLLRERQEQTIELEPGIRQIDF